jgi:hypothetical protein
MDNPERGSANSEQPPRRKLQIARETLRQLGARAMRGVAGGTQYTDDPNDAAHTCAYSCWDTCGLNNTCDMTCAADCQTHDNAHTCAAACNSDACTGTDWPNTSVAQCGPNTTAVVGCNPQSPMCASAQENGCG